MTPRSIPSPHADLSVFNIWIFQIHMYAICILVGIIVAVLLTSRRLTKRGAEPGIVVDIALPTVVLGIIVARLYHVVTHPADYFGTGASFIDTVWHIIAIWEGGNAIFGGLIGGAIGAWIGCRWTGVRFWTFADALAPGLLFAQAIGRIGNWFNHELFGQPTDLPWGLEIESDNPAFPAGLPDGTLFHPMFLYELLWDAFGGLLLLLIARNVVLQWGKLFALYLVWYGAGRIWFESIRVDPSEVFLGLRVNIWGAIVAVLVGVLLFVVQSRRHPGLEPGAYVPGREWVAKDKQVGSTYTAEDFDGDGEPVAESAGAPATSGANSSRGSGPAS